MRDALMAIKRRPATIPRVASVRRRQQPGDPVEYGYLRCPGAGKREFDPGGREQLCHHHRNVTGNVVCSPLARSLYASMELSSAQFR